MSVSTMKKLTVFAYAQDTDAIVRKLMGLKCVDIRNTAERGLMPPSTAECDAQKAQTERRLADIRRAMSLLSPYAVKRGLFGGGRHRVNRTDFLAEGRDGRAWNAVTEVLKATATRDALAEEKARTQTLLKSLTPWLSYDAPLNHGGSRKTVQILGAYPAKTDISAVRADLEAAGAYIEEISADAHGVYVVITALREDMDQVERKLVAEDCRKIAFPEIATTARAAGDAAEMRLLQIDVERDALEEKIRNLAEHLDDIEILCDIESTTLNVCLQKRKLAATKRCVVLSGWIPTVAEERVLRALAGFECAVELADPNPDDEIPVLLKNRSFAANFEWVIGMYSYPKYGTFDPTLIMSIFYFLIFGMMFADVGYGLLLALACFGGVKLLNLKPSMKRMLLMFGYCGLSCMVMGVLFGGWFGNLPTAIMNSFIYHADGVAEQTPLGSFFYNGLIFNPIEAPTAFLVVALAMGEIHLIAGMAINMIETIKRGRALEAVCSTVPFWVLFLGLDLMAPAVFTDMFFGGVDQLSQAAQNVMAMMSVIGKYAMFAGFALIFLLKGVGRKGFFGWLIGGLGGLYSLISYASDLLSYSRILALGLVAGVIAQVVNLLTGLGAGSPIGFVFMVVVMLLGHVLNLAINLLGTFVHAARLQYIEFFGKFYEDGGDPFDPALPAEEFSQIPENE